ncbi:MAG: hypothetical protein IT423_00280 [Pirellulaceae bacterium]|nr:hypothetical protein [Pirellulaceae bacterium]
MKWLRGVGGWCALGVAVTAIGGGAVLCKQYAEQHLLASVLGPGTRAESFRLHWSQAAGCAEEVEIPLTYATDVNQQPLQLFASKLWFAYDQSALLRKRFVLPRVIIEDATISADYNQFDQENIVDVDFALDVSEGEAGAPLWEAVDSAPQSPTGLGLANAPESGNNKPAQESLPGKGTASPAQKWFDDLQQLCSSLLSERYASGRQVAVDADMVSERMQGHFQSLREHPQRTVNEARDIQQQISAMDNVLRHEVHVIASRERLEELRLKLISMKSDLSRVDRLLSEEQSRVRSALLVEKEALQLQSTTYAAPPADQVAKFVIERGLGQQLSDPARYVVLLSDLILKPFECLQSQRGQPIRHVQPDAPQFAAESTKISGQVEIEGRAWPFTASGSFQILPESMINDSAEMTQEASIDGISTDVLPNHVSANRLSTSQWRMSIDRGTAKLDLDGQSIDHESGRARVSLKSHASEELAIECEVQAQHVSATGHLDLRQWLAQSKVVEHMTRALVPDASGKEPWIELIDQALKTTDDTPEQLMFEVSQLTDQPTWTVGQEVVQWLDRRLTSQASQHVAKHYVQASEQLEVVVQRKLGDQTRMVALLRNDAEQHLGQHLEELRKLQAAVNTHIQQRVGTHFARQPKAEVPR